MRRFWIVVAAVVAFSSIAAGPGIAYARTESPTKASSCTDLVKKYQKVNSASANIDLSKPTSLNRAFKQGSQTLKSLASNGPSQLRSSFKRLATAFDKLSKIDFSNPTSLSGLTTLETTYASDLQKIAAYFSKQCNVTLPTSPGGATAGTPSS
jgi:hypothetical protein